MKRKYLIKGPISSSLIGEYLDSLSAFPECGGIATFMGQVRADMVDEKPVKEIEYSAYDELVAKEAERIISVTKAAFPDVKKIEIIHATGKVGVGEISLFVMVASEHRDQAFRACRHVVEMIKIHYPVWKKEIFEDDTHHWKENTR